MPLGDIECAQFHRDVGPAADLIAQRQRVLLDALPIDERPVPASIFDEPHAVVIPRQPRMQPGHAGVIDHDRDMR